MGFFLPTVKRFKESCLKITSSNIGSKSSAIQQAADTPLSAVFETSSTVPAVELPTNDPKNCRMANEVFELPTMLPEESTAKIICEGSPSSKGMKSKKSNLP